MFFDTINLCYSSNLEKIRPLLLFFFFNNLFIFLFYFDRAGSSLLCGIFSGCSDWGLFFIAMCWLLIEAAFLIVEHGLSSCGLRA